MAYHNLENFRTGYLGKDFHKMPRNTGVWGQYSETVCVHVRAMQSLSILKIEGSNINRTWNLNKSQPLDC